MRARWHARRCCSAGLGIVVGYILMESVVVLTVASFNAADGPRYNTSAVILCTELLKLAVSLCSLWAARRLGGAVPRTLTAGASSSSCQVRPNVSDNVDDGAEAVEQDPLCVPPSGSDIPATTASPPLSHSLPPSAALPEANEAVTGTGTGEEGGLSELKRIKPCSMLLYAVPSLMFAIDNNLYLHILTLMSPAHFQLLLNSRVVWTGIAFRCCLRRHLSPRQWVACCTLLVGCVLSQYGTGTGTGTSTAPPNTEDASRDAVAPVTSLGLILTGVYCIVSVAGSVSCEVLLKAEPSLHVANVQFYVWGVAFNALGLVWQSRASLRSFALGWDEPRVWLVCGAYVASGLLISRVMKHFDSIVKIFCSAGSNLVVYAVSVATGELPLVSTFVAAMALVAWSAYRYASVPSTPPPPTPLQQLPPPEPLLAPPAQFPSQAQALASSLELSGEPTELVSADECGETLAC